jgi:hypothetical protein
MFLKLLLFVVLWHALHVARSRQVNELDKSEIAMLVGLTLLSEGTFT